MCGGEGCNGTVRKSMVALNKAREASDNLTAASDKLQSITRKVPRHFFLKQTAMQVVTGSFLLVLP